MRPLDDRRISLLLTDIGYAKVNLALHVRERRADGYHSLESLFVFADHGDVLTAEPSDEISLTIEGPFASSIAGESDNLVIRAANALRETFGIQEGARIHLTKNLPVASGIGGGSSDAAAAIRLLTRLWKLDVPPDRLHKIALTLGSDVPACLSSRTQLVGGRGDVLSDASIADIEGAPMLLINPNVPLSTGPVFAGWDQLDRGALEVFDLQSLQKARNDLEPSAIALISEIDLVLEQVRRQNGVKLARMSGSGATCFALFETAKERNTAAANIQKFRPDWWIMKTRIKTA